LAHSGNPSPRIGSVGDLEVRPQILKKQKGEALTFKLHVDDVDLSMLPEFVDRGVVDIVNAELDAKHVELAWSFTKTLSHVFALPDALASAGAMICARRGAA